MTKFFWGYRILAILALAWLSYEAVAYAWQPLVDRHAFRQTQTALTSFWMQKEGFSLAYQTPVLGFPWSIPFEFPIYQAIVASLSSLTGMDLSAMGRLISFLFLIACMWPIFGIAQRLDWPKSVPWIACTLLWSSPLYVYWGRTFMIETGALFFALTSLMYAIDVFQQRGGWLAVVLFVLFASAGVLQKSTTEGPILLFLILAIPWVYLKGNWHNKQAWKAAVLMGVVVALPLCIGLAWAHYSDVVKEQNPFGAKLTAHALSRWNFGTLEQRLNVGTWKRWFDRLAENTGMGAGLVLLFLPWLYRRGQRSLARYSLVALTLFLLPLLIFTNLHFVHDYYQVANMAFILVSLSLAIGWLEKGQRVWLGLILTALLMVSNVTVYQRFYGKDVLRASSQAYEVGIFLKNNTPSASGIVVLGQDWSSEVAFFAERKSVTVKDWFGHYHELWEYPEKFLGPVPVAAIAVCPQKEQDFPDEADIQKKMNQESGWRM
jgi:4-amino-4-deoxy-L-arabinose transferase-like glycosyltransferase